MLKKSASGVLTSLRGSTYRSVRLASSLAAALLDGIFEHPARCSLVVPDMQAVKVWPAYLVFPQHARGVMKMPPGS
jgi:hypothetical protein